MNVFASHKSTEASELNRDTNISFKKIKIK